MKNCSNCKHRDKCITEEPCMDCRFTENWEPAEDEFDPEEDDES